MNKFFLILFAMLCIASKVAWSMTPPEIDWKVLETEHFEIVYDARHVELAKLYALEAELVYKKLSSHFQDKPKKTVIWINDVSDAANGSATFFPRPFIVIYPTLPSPSDSISYYDRWSHLLLLHEYTHILTFEPANNLWSALRFLFGRVASPSLFLPTWYLEGIAVETESRYTGYGRLRSPYYSALIRAMVRDQTWFQDGLGRINDLFIPEWPYGQRPYFWGALILREMTLKKDASVLNSSMQEHGGSWPYALNGVPECLLGLDYNQLLESARQRYVVKARAQIDEIKKSTGSHQMQAIESLGQGVQRFFTSPDKLHAILIKTNDNGDSELHLLTRSSPTEEFDFNISKPVYVGKRINSIVWDKDSNESFIFDQTDTDHLYYSYSDLYRYHVTEKKTKRLSRLARLSEPSRFNDRIVAIQTEGAINHVVLLNDQAEILTKIYSSPMQSKISSPTLVSENEVLFTLKNAQGISQLFSINILNSQIRELQKDKWPIEKIEHTTAGLLALSTASGTSNLYYAKDTTSPLTALTNSQTQISNFSYDDSTQSVYVTELSGRGNVLLKHPGLQQSIQPKKLDSLIEGHSPQTPTEALEPTAMEESNYNSFSYLLPTYWYPFITFIPEGVFLSATTGGADPLGKQQYVLSVNYDNVTNKMGGGGIYGFQVHDGLLSIGGTHQNQHYYAYDLTSVSRFGYAHYTFPFTRSYADLLGSVRWSYYSSELPNDLYYYYSGPGAQISYSNASQKPTQISPEKGFSTRLDYEYFLSNTSNIEFSRTRFDFTGYSSWLLPKRHAFALNTKTVWSPRNRNILLGEDAGNEFNIDLGSTAYVIRGYPIGEFIGWSLATTSLEYRFPLPIRESGYSTLPIYFRRWHGTVFVDAITLDGIYYDKDLHRSKTTALGRWFYSAGTEAISDLTLGYRIPVQLKFGVSYGFTEEAYGGWSFFVGLKAASF